MSSWSALAQVKYNVQTDQSWARRSPSAFPLARPWRGKLQPVVATSATRLVVAAGHHLYSYSFAVQAPEGHAPRVRPECICALGATDGDATALAFVPDGGEDKAVVVGFSNGALDYIRLEDAGLTVDACELPDDTYGAVRAGAALDSSLRDDPYAGGVEHCREEHLSVESEDVFGAEAMLGPCEASELL